MFWLFKILMDKNLKQAERNRRKAYMLENNKLIAEIRKLLIVQQSLSKAQIESDLFSQALFKSDFKKLIFAVDLINKSINFLWVPSNKVEKVQNFVRKTKTVLRSFIAGSHSMKAFDQFGSNSIDPDSIFSQNSKTIDIAHLNIDDFRSKIKL